jgi:hypothetical protein
MLTLKTIAIEAVPTALEKARQYRLLNEPNDAESICLDILAVTPDNQEALKTLLLALTDKFAVFGVSPSFEQASEIVGKLDTSHCKAYYSGIIYERRAKFHLKQGGPGAGTAAYQWLVKAMDAFNMAITECDTKNQEAVLRWNACARIINSNPEVHAADEDDRGGEMLLDPFDTPHW